MKGEEQLPAGLPDEGERCRADEVLEEVWLYPLGTMSTLRISKPVGSSVSGSLSVHCKICQHHIKEVIEFTHGFAKVVYSNPRFYIACGLL